MLRLTLLIVTLTISTTAQAQNSCDHVISSLENGLDLAPYMAVLVDHDGTLSIDDISSDEYSNSFVQITKSGTSFGFTNNVYWLRLRIKTGEKVKSSQFFLEHRYPLVDHVTLFTPDGRGGFCKKETGDALPFAAREVKYRNNLFEIMVAPDQEQYWYLRLQTEGSLQFPMTLWQSADLIEHIDSTNMILGIYYGIMLLLMIASLASYFKIRDNLFFFYSLYLLSYILFQFSLNGLSYQYLWPDLPWLTSRLTSAFVGFVIVCGVLFSGSFLQIWKENHPKVKMLFYVLMTCGAFSIMLSLLGSYYIAVRIAAIAGAFLPPIVIIATWSSISRGYTPARYFLAAWCVFLLGVFVASLLYLGLLPHSFFTVYAMQIGSTFEVLLLGYALMAKIDILRIEKTEAKEDATRYLIQLNEELETMVNKRTLELQKKNEELKNLVRRDSMTGLLNHRASMECLKKMQDAAKRYQHGLAVLMLDIDYFKKINDTYGHQAGDTVLMAIAKILTETIRSTDCCGRYGGEEFILLLAETDEHSSMIMAERIRKDIHALEIPEIHGARTAVSIGIAMFNPDKPDENLISKADTALYKAKHNGRNQVQMYK